MKTSAQLTCFVQRIEAVESVAGKTIGFDIGELSTAMRRIAHEVNALELELETHRAACGLGSEYLSNIITRARWILSLPSNPPTIKELAEAVIVLAGMHAPNS